MSETLEARDFIVDFLRRELVGPSPGYPVVQIDKQEILRAQDPPRQRYCAGILFPTRSQVVSQNYTGKDEVATQNAESPEPDPIVEDFAASEPPERIEVSPGESPPETDRDVTLANELLPSAMGLSALLEVPERLRVEVQAAIYLNEELRWDTRAVRDPKEPYQKGWWRRPCWSTLGIVSRGITGECHCKT